MNYAVSSWLDGQNEERKRCRDIALRVAEELKSSGVDTDGSLAAERVAREIMNEAENHQDD